MSEVLDLASHILTIKTVVDEFEKLNNLTNRPRTLFRVDDACVLDVLAMEPEEVSVLSEDDAALAKCVRDVVFVLGVLQSDFRRCCDIDLP